MILEKYFDKVLEKLYGNNPKVLANQILRYQKLFDSFSNHFDDNDVYIFSTPGRTEICGNHTDHNLGKVLAASINLDSIAVAAKNDSDKIKLYSEGYKSAFEIDLNNLDKVEEESGTTNSLLRGIASRFKKLGYNIGGFNAAVTSDVLPGSGLSSSASVEVLIGSILNSLFNSGKISNVELAKIGQWAENNYFGKPCGLMDQMACAVGGIISIDFEEPENPIVEKIEFDFQKTGYKMLIVDSGSDHEDLTDDYASIPEEMKTVAVLLNKNVCREIDEPHLFEQLKLIREKAGDRALLRVLHFFNENKRVEKQIIALAKNDFNLFLDLVQESGDSSIKWLQNIYSPQNVTEQSVSLALALTEKFFLENGKGACRIHGGGFAGTIQVFMRNDIVEEYKSFIEGIIGQRKVIVLDIRSEGSCCLN